MAQFGRRDFVAEWVFSTSMVKLGNLHLWPHP